MDINVIASTNQSTVVSQYNPVPRTRKAYQSEAELEQELIDNLVSIGYEYLNIHDEKDLLNNLKKQLEKLNNTVFTDDGVAILSIQTNGNIVITNPLAHTMSIHTITGIVPFIINLNS